MSASQPTFPRAPAAIRLFGPAGRLLLQLGVPMGPDKLLTIRGRRTGRPRTVGLAVVELRGRRYVIGTYGEVQWVRNLRAAGEAVVGRGRRRERVRAVELDPAEAATVLADLAAYIRALPWALRAVTLFMLRFGGAREVIDDPGGAAHRRPVFELTEPDDAGR
jgi:deazaflavin-dependent oxidoreductase (nitroreductase family)